MAALRLCLWAALATSCHAHVPPARCERVVAFSPWDETTTPVVGRVAPARGVADSLLVFYQRHMRQKRLPGQGCRLRPTCSVFARQAVDRYGVLGLVLTADRLFVRENPFMDAHYLPACASGRADEQGLYDPVP